jgi:hypothetical protein
MKRLIAKRILKNNCIQCNEPILKGKVYYRERKVYTDDSKIYGFTSNYCARCNHYNKHHEIRYKNFQKKCTHPYEFIATEWSYIPGECVKEPNYDYCLLCGEILL